MWTDPHAIKIPVAIYHRNDDNRFWELEKAREFGGVPTLEHAYTYSLDFWPSTDLGDFSHT